MEDPFSGLGHYSEPERSRFALTPRPFHHSSSDDSGALAYNARAHRRTLVRPCAANC